MSDAEAFPKTLMMARSSPPAVTGSAVVVGNLARQFSRNEMTVIGALDPGNPRANWSTQLPRLLYPMVWSSRWRGGRWLRRAQFPLVLLVSMWAMVAGRHKAVLALYPDDLYLMAAYLVARITRRPLYGYFHNTYLENHRGSRFARWLQPRVFRSARHVFVISEGLERLYRRNYPTLSVSPLVHTFCEEMPPAEAPPPIHDPVRLCLAGTINPANIDAGRRMAQMVQEVEDVQLEVLLGSSPSSTAMHAGFAGPRVTAVHALPREGLLKRLRRSDVLLLPHGFKSAVAQEEIQTIFPTKLIEYLLCGRPILAHVPGGCYLEEFLRRHKCAMVVDEPSVEALRHALSLLRGNQALRAELVSNGWRALRQFEATRVAEHLRDVMANAH